MLNRIKQLLRVVFLFLGLWLGIEMVCRIGGEILWFQNVGYLPVYLVRLGIKGLLGLGGFGITAGYLLVNLAVAQRCRYSPSSGAMTMELAIANKSGLRSRLRLPPRIASRTAPEENRLMPLGLPWLFLLATGLGLFSATIWIYYGQIAWSDWYAGLASAHTVLSLPIPFRPEPLWNFLKQGFSQPSFYSPILAITIALLIYPPITLRTFSLGFSGIFGVILAEHWDKVLLNFHAIPFDKTEAVFQRDVGFYVFNLPIWQLLELWWLGLAWYGLIAVACIYLLSGNSLNEGYFPGFSQPQQRHLYALGGVLMLGIALSEWVSRYELLYSLRGVTFGASYTDVTAQLPAHTILSFVSLAIALYLFWRSRFWSQQLTPHKLLFSGLGAYLLLMVGLGKLWPLAMQYLIVQPNELAREVPYLQRTIAATRQAFDLENIDVQTFEPQGQLTQTDLQANDLTIRNIRLWDERPLLETNRQLQQIRPYYRFSGADIDRYRFPTEPSQDAPTSLEQRQVLIAARELDYSAVPQQAQTWVNRHLIYTHGYGFTLSPVNTAAAGGLPEYFVKDIGADAGGTLTAFPEAISAGIPVAHPRIYYGELTNNYVMTGTQVKELDYPSGSDNVYTVYDGAGGINIGAIWRRILFAKYLNDWRMMFTQDFLPETKLLFRRNINRRIRAIAPFLRYDSDPYLVAVKVEALGDREQGAGEGQRVKGEGERGQESKNNLYWIVDAYTTSDHYPYSDLGKENINYIRNSIKVVIDAYHGSVQFYVSDVRDPIVKAWSQVFPNLFQSLSAMPVEIRQHIRYPVDLFRIQADRLIDYHMTDSQVFYNREDQWQIPTEVYGDRPQLVEPYYLITSLPSVPFEEFILLLPYTPRQRTNLTAWLAARSDGDNYGKLLLYLFPKQRLIYGPEQIEARINQDPVISQQITLWNRQGSRAIQGNLLVIPIERSLLYVEPLYLEATQNRLPTLARVIVAYENQIVMAQTLEQALNAIFQPKTPPPPIVRSVE
jgi:uncharacterized membrane protein (UPF0182 family)